MRQKKQNTNSCKLHIQGKSKAMQKIVTFSKLLRNPYKSLENYKLSHAFSAQFSAHFDSLKRTLFHFSTSIYLYLHRGVKELYTSDPKIILSKILTRLFQICNECSE